MDFEDKKGDASPARRPNSSLLEETVNTIGALAGGSRANAHYMELHKEDEARRAEAIVLAAKGFDVGPVEVMYDAWWKGMCENSGRRTSRPPSPSPKSASRPT